MNRIVFGPVPSRRLGQSLGINNIPYKNCSYSCLYCQVGITKNPSVERKAFYPPERIAAETGEILGKLKGRGEKVDFLTFVPDGEPTLDVNIGKEIRSLKDFGIKVAVITNASLLWKEDVREDLMEADLVSAKVDAVEPATWKKINRPAEELDYGVILKGIEKFCGEFGGTLLTETLLIRDINDSEEEVRGVARFISRLKPSVAFVGIPTRPPAEKWVLPPDPEFVNRAYLIFMENGLNTELILGGGGEASFGYTGDIEGDLLNIISVHPMSGKQVEEFLKKAGGGWSSVENLLKEKKAREIEYAGQKYYLRDFTH